MYDDVIKKPFELAFGAIARDIAGKRLRASSGVSENADLFMNTALALLEQSRLAAAVCGDKSALGDREPAYYRAFYDFAKRQPDLAVVRIFGQWSGSLDKARERCREHNDETRPTVLGLWVDGVPGSADDPARPSMSDLMTVTTTGLVLFRGPLVTTALLHFKGEKSPLTWAVSSDPLVTTVLLDAWCALSKLDRELADPRRHAELSAFRRRFGMADG